MNDNSAGSYQLDSLNDPDGELARLRNQGEMFREMEVNILKKSGLKTHHNVLELGCGPGFITKILADFASDGELISIDNDSNLLDLLQKEKIPSPKKGFRTLHASAADLPLGDGWSDFSYARFLLQHVPSPLDVISEAYRCTKPGGLFCAVDSDDGLIICYPESEKISSFLKDVSAKQSAYGGDRFIGRKLHNLFHHAGFTHIKASSLSMTTTEISPQALLGILFGYKSSLLSNKETITDLIAELTAKAVKEEFVLSGGVFIVVGQKPVA